MKNTIVNAMNIITKAKGSLALAITSAFKTKANMIPPKEKPTPEMAVTIAGILTFSGILNLKSPVTQSENNNVWTNSSGAVFK